MLLLNIQKYVCNIFFLKKNSKLLYHDRLFYSPSPICIWDFKTCYWPFWQICPIEHVSSIKSTGIFHIHAPVMNELHVLLYIDLSLFYFILLLSYIIFLVLKLHLFVGFDLIVMNWIYTKKKKLYHEKKLNMVW